MGIREITFDDAIYEALDEEMEGDERVIDTPIAESGFTGAAVGAAIAGMKPVVCHGRADFMLYAYDSIANQASKWRFQTGESSRLPMVVRAGTGGHRGSGCHHSQSLETLFLNVPGIDIAIPSTPYDAKGLLKTALRSVKPVLFFEHTMLRRVKGPVPEAKYTVPFGEADIKAEGEDVTVVATAFMVWKALSVAERMDTEGVSVEVLDLRTLVPLDCEAIIRSVNKTGRLVTVEEGCMSGGVGSEVASVVAESIPSALETPVIRVANPDAIIPYKVENEAHVLPQEDGIERAIRTALESARATS